MRRADISRPIGVFDSGLGGLTVFKALSRRLPGEDLVYFGDTAHVPYGSKSAEEVERCSLAAARFLMGKRVKALVVACNTSSALALPRLRRELPVPVIGVIEPGARAAASASRGGRVGVIGTEATVLSGAYPAALRIALPGAKVKAAACPLFVPLVEEGWWGGPVALETARRYLSPIKRFGVDTLILGCTHYPLLKGVIGRVMGPGVRLVDSAVEVSREAARQLEAMGLRRDGTPRRGRWSFYASDAPPRVLRLARRWLGAGELRVELANLP